MKRLKNKLISRNTRKTFLIEKSSCTIMHLQNKMFARNVATVKHICGAVGFFQVFNAILILNEGLAPKLETSKLVVLFIRSAREDKLNFCCY
jgi:hypothetical protein